MTNGDRAPTPSCSADNEPEAADLPKDNSSESPTFRITQQQWSELEDSVTAFHAALDCEAQEGGEGAELIKAVYIRLNKAVTDMRETIFGGR